MQQKILRLLIVSLCAIAAPALAQQKEAPSQQAPARAPQQPTVIRDCPECPEMVIIPPGTFTIGSESTQPGRFGNEGPTRQVQVKRFAMAKHHVTRAQFAAFVEETKHAPQPGCTVELDRKWVMLADRDWRRPGFPQQDDHPVVCVSWIDANAFAQWLSKKTMRVYRLPTEAEFEYAARARTGTTRFWGDDPSDACEYANATDESAVKALELAGIAGSYFRCNDGFVFTSPAGHFKPNAFGLHDMLGNAWQWVEDCYFPDYNTLAADGAVRREQRCARQTVRGGGFLYSPNYIRSAVREAAPPTARLFTIGFRVALTMGN